MKNVNKEDVMSKAMMAYVANDHYYYPSAGMSVTACRVKRVADVIVSLIALIIFSSGREKTSRKSHAGYDP